MTDNRQRPSKLLPGVAFCDRRGWRRAPPLQLPPAAKSTVAANGADPAITELKDWNQYLGYGVDAQGYGVPSSFEESTIRRWVPWLTAICRKLGQLLAAL